MEKGLFMEQRLQVTLVALLLLLYFSVHSSVTTSKLKTSTSCCVVAKYAETISARDARCALSATGFRGSGLTIYVDDDNTGGPWEGNIDHPYQNITSAFLHSSTEDTIYIRRGLYLESLAINRTVSLLGEDSEETVIDGTTSGAALVPVVQVSGENVKVTLSNLTIRGSKDSWGVVVTFLAEAWIENTKVTNNSGGILVNFSNNNTFINNTIVDNQKEGILFLSSSQNVMKNNRMNGNKYNFGLLQSSCDHDIDTSNLVEGKPVFYLKNQTGLTINPALFPAIGYLALINCSNVTVTNLTLQGNYNGLLLAGTKNSTVKGNSVSNNSRGIDIVNSFDNVFEANNITDQGWIGMSLDHAPSNRFMSNSLLNNRYSFKIEGDSISDFTQDLDLSNTVNEKLMYYLISQTDTVLSPSTHSDIGYLALVNCNNITVIDLGFENNELCIAFTNSSIIKGNRLVSSGTSVSYCESLDIAGNSIANGEIGLLLHHSNASRVERNNITDHNSNGIVLRASSDNTVFGNNIDNDTIGLELTESLNNTIFRNNITRNRFYGVVLTNSAHNLFYHNNFINDIPWQVVGSYPIVDSFDNGYPTGGNYWPDYNGNDTHSGTYRNETASDGIGDTRYTNFFGVIDKYPLMKPIQNFEISTSQLQTQTLGMISNSTISDLILNESQKTIGFKVSGQEGSTGFCRIIIPNKVAQILWSGNYNVTANGEIMEFRNWTDALNTYLYVDYAHPQKEIVIIPEYPSTIIYSIIMLTALLLMITLERKPRQVRTAT